MHEFMITQKQKGRAANAQDPSGDIRENRKNQPEQIVKSEKEHKEWYI
jgi:hypothetical protein